MQQQSSSSVIHNSQCKCTSHQQRFHSTYKCTKTEYGKTSQTVLQLSRGSFSKSIQNSISKEVMEKGHLHISGRDVQGHMTGPLQVSTVPCVWMEQEMEVLKCVFFYEHQTIQCKQLNMKIERVLNFLEMWLLFCKTLFVEVQLCTLF